VEEEGDEEEEDDDDDEEEEEDDDDEDEESKPGLKYHPVYRSKNLNATKWLQSVKGQLVKIY